MWCHTSHCGKFLLFWVKLSNIVDIRDGAIPKKAWFWLQRYVETERVCSNIALFSVELCPTLRQNKNSRLTVIAKTSSVLAWFWSESRWESRRFGRCVWMWESITGGLQPQQWHHGIISTWHSPRVTKISLCMFNVDVGSNQRW